VLCNHRGLGDEGGRYIEIMNRDYNIKPTTKHYGCMVDLLWRAGLVEEAYNLIKSIPVECNAIIYGGHCWLHVEIMEMLNLVRK
jgi:hypothetical protein